MQEHVLTHYITQLTREYTEEFMNQWRSGQFVPIGEEEVKKANGHEDGANGDQMDTENNGGDAHKENGAQDKTNNDAKNEADPLFCKYCKKTFAKDTVFTAHLKGKKHLAAVKKQTGSLEEVYKSEVIINRLSDLLVDQIEATKQHIEIKQGLRPEELENENAFEEVEDEDEEEEEVKIQNSFFWRADLTNFFFVQEVRLTKMNYPVGWDGQPIPYWLYKLNGLGNEYKCEICGNTSYWGRRAFEKHFQVIIFIVIQIILLMYYKRQSFIGNLELITASFDFIANSPLFIYMIGSYSIISNTNGAYI